MDKVSQTREVESRNHVAFEKEVDRIYLDGGKCDLTVLQNAVPTVQLQSLNFRDCVVWNPWIEKSKAMADFDDDEVWLWEFNLSSHPSTWKWCA